MVSAGSGWSVVGRITLSNESLNEHATGTTTPSPNHDRLSYGDRGYDGIISKGRHLDPVSEV